MQDILLSKCVLKITMPNIFFTVKPTEVLKDNGCDIFIDNDAGVYSN